VRICVFGRWAGEVFLWIFRCGVLVREYRGLKFLGWPRPAGRHPLVCNADPSMDGPTVAIIHSQQQHVRLVGQQLAQYHQERGPQTAAAAAAECAHNRVNADPQVAPGGITCVTRLPILSRGVVRLCVW
jgi:hypothetical protein